MADDVHLNTALLRPDITAQLGKVQLLSGLSAVVLLKVTAALQLRTVGRGDHVLHKGSAGEHLLFLLSGRLQAVDLTEDGREIGLNFLSMGDYFGELSIIDGLPRSASVVAIENSLIGFLPRIEALSLIYDNPLIAERLLKRMASSVRMSANYRLIIGIPNAFQRVFALLNNFTMVMPGGLVVIEKMPTQKEISIMVNTTRETVSRAINSLLRHGVVEKDMRRLIVRRPEILLKTMIEGVSAMKDEKSKPGKSDS